MEAGAQKRGQRDWPSLAPAASSCFSPTVGTPAGAASPAQGAARALPGRLGPHAVHSSHHPAAAWELSSTWPVLVFPHVVMRMNVFTNFLHKVKKIQ